MAASLYAQQALYGYEIELVDIDEDDELKQRYHVDIPVAVHNDQVIFYHFFDEQRLRQTFKHG